MEGGGEASRDRDAVRGESDAVRGDSALGDLAQFLIENPWMNQALQVAFGARERASQAGATVIRNLNLPTGNDVDRIARRLRALSERLEEVEDTLDQLSREIAELRREREASGPRTSRQG